MNDQVEGRGDLLPDRAQRQVDACSEHQHLEARKRVARVVRMNGGKRSFMPGIHRLEHVERLGAANLADDDPVGPHAQRVANQLPDPHFALTLDVRRPRLERDDMPLLELQLGRVLNRHDALIVRDEGRERIQHRRLARAGPAGNEHVDLAANARCEECRRLGRQRPEGREVRKRVRVPRELPDRQRRATERQRRDDGIHAAAVRKSCVDHGGCLVDATSDLRDNSVDDAEHVRVVDERDVCELDLAIALDVHVLRSVDHDLGDRGVTEERLERAVAEDVVGELLLDADSLDARERRPHERELLGDRVAYPGRELLRRADLEQRGPQLLDAGPMDASFQLGMGIGPWRRPRATVDRVVDEPTERGGGRGALVGAGKTVVEVHSVTRVRNFRSRLRSPARPSFVIRSATSSLTAPANRLFGFMIVAGIPELMLVGTTESSGSVYLILRPIVSAISCGEAPPAIPERFETSEIRSTGNPSRSRVCSASRMFFIDGTSGVDTSRIWSLRSSAVSIGPSKSGAVSMTITSYIPRAVWRIVAIRAASIASPSSGRSGAGTTCNPLSCVTTKPRSFSRSRSAAAA